jgi:hypothetical protein
MHQIKIERRLRMLGALIIVCVLINNIFIHNFSNILWLCNISTLLAGIGLLLGFSQIALIGATYMILGLFFWLSNVLVNHTFGNLGSYVTHFGFAVAGLILFRYISVSRSLWLGCFAWYLFSQILARLFSPPEDNINLAFAVWPGWDKIFRSFFWFWLLTTLSCMTFLFVANRIIWQSQIKRRQKYETA